MTRRSFLKLASIASLCGACATGPFAFFSKMRKKNLGKKEDKKTGNEKLPNGEKSKKGQPDEKFQLFLIQEEARVLPEKIIAKEDFPIDEKKFSSYFDCINKKGIEWSTLRNRETNEIIVPGHPVISIDMAEFKKIFFSKQFQEILESRAGNMTYMNAISLTHAVYREMFKRKNSGDLFYIETDIKSIAKLILDNIDNMKPREIFGPNTNLIIFCHEEGSFDNDSIINEVYYPFGGREDKILASEKGMQIMGCQNARLEINKWLARHPRSFISKKYFRKIAENYSKVNITKVRTLCAIAACNGDTTILFHGHGSPEVWAFSKNQASNLDRSRESHPEAITFEELGDALIESGNISNVNLVGLACLSYDYVLNLFQYLESRGVVEKPRLSIVNANKSEIAFVSTDTSYVIKDYLLLEMLDKAKKSNDGRFTADAFFKAEGKVCFMEDPAIFIGSPYEFSPNSRLGSGSRNIPPQQYLELGAVRSREIGEQQSYIG